MGGSTQRTPSKNMVWDRHTRTHSITFLHIHTHTHTEHISPQKQGSTYTIQHALSPRDSWEAKHTHGNKFNVKVWTQHTQGRGTAGGFQRKVQRNYGQRNRRSLLSSCLLTCPEGSLLVHKWTWRHLKQWEAEIACQLPLWGMFASPPVKWNIKGYIYHR